MRRKANRLVWGAIVAAVVGLGAIVVMGAVLPR